MVFKKSSYIITNKNGCHAVCVLLKEDFNPHTDRLVPYVNWFDVYYKPRTKKVVTDVWPTYEDNNGGTLSFCISDNWHYAPKNVISRADYIVRLIDAGEYSEDKLQNKSRRIVIEFN